MATKKKPVGGAAPEAAETRGARARAKSSSVKARTGASRKPAASRAAAKPGARAPKPSARKAAKPAAAPKATRKTAAPRAKPGARAGAAKSAAAKTKSASRARGSRTAAVEAAEAPRAVPGLSEEDQIRAAKFLPRELPKRLFEEERFLFPESYGQNRIRLLVRDPEWIFAYWDVKPQALEDLAKSLGERALALSRLTLRVVAPVSGGSTDILLPAGARWWYVKTDAARRT